jgi:uncharacterized surface protein with fasciclin (FAS1) repeats
MKSITIGLAILLFTFATYSCKNNTSSESEITTVVDGSANVNQRAKKELTEDEKLVLKSVMSKIMINRELSSFSSALVTGGLTQMLSTDKGPYTVFAPSNQAFENLTEANKKVLYNKANLALFKKLLENHIVEGNLTSSLLNEKESTAITGSGGTQLVVFRKGDELWVKDQNGKEAKIVQQDLLGNNGVIHIIDQVLNLN